MSFQADLRYDGTVDRNPSAGTPSSLDQTPPQVVKVRRSYLERIG